MISETSVKAVLYMRGGFFISVSCLKMFGVTDSFIIKTIMIKTFIC